MSSIVDIRACADHIETLQGRDGAINWIDRGIWDAWNHGESAMALAIAGRRETAMHALDALLDRQEADGSWIGDLGASVAMDEDNRRLAPHQVETARDTNFTAYSAVTVLRSLLALDALEALPRYWPMIDKAITHILTHQTGHGDILWRAVEDGNPADIDSLRAGNASIYKALECAITLAGLKGEKRPHWARARSAIGAALRENDARFDRFETDRRRYAMDWYYPVLTGVLTPEAGRARLYARWNEFVQAGLGCRCVADEPWVTAAETAELAMACLSARKPDQARQLLEGLAPLAANEGGYWMGWQFCEEIVWPRERPSWTAGALVLAADALDALTPGSTLLIRNNLPEIQLKPDGEAAPAFRPV